MRPMFEREHGSLLGIRGCVSRSLPGSVSGKYVGVSLRGSTDHPWERRWEYPWELQKDILKSVPGSDAKESLGVTLGV